MLECLDNALGNLRVTLDEARQALSDLRHDTFEKRLPDALFGTLLGGTMKIDPEARSSMWEDLQRGRRTEIDYLQGVIIAVADRHGLQVPLTRRIVALIRSAEAAGKGPPKLRPEQIRSPSSLKI